MLGLYFLFVKRVFWFFSRHDINAFGFSKRPATPKTPDPVSAPDEFLHLPIARLGLKRNPLPGHVNPVKLILHELLASKQIAG
jgi:hypothetical protein